MDIYQQDGTPQRMYYEGVGKDMRQLVEWIGVMEETAEQFRRNTNAQEEPPCK